MRKVCLLFLALSFFSINEAKADTLRLAATIGGVNVCAADNNVGCLFGAVLLDQDPLIGRLSLDPALIGGLDIQGSLYTQTIGGVDILNSSSLQITNTTGATVTGTVAVSGTNFTGPVNSASISGSGTWEQAIGSTIGMTWYNDPTNQQGADTATDTPGNLLFTFSDAAGTSVDSFNVTQNGIPIFDPALYSMTVAFQLSLTSGGRLVSRGQTLIKEFNPIPEPASLILLGSGLVGLATRFRNKKKLVKQ